MNGLSVSLDLDAIVGHEQYDGDGEPVGGPVTLLDRIAELAAIQLVHRLAKDRDKDTYGGLVKRAQDIRDDEIREQVKVLIEEALSAPIFKTNGYGERSSEPTTLREIIAETVRKELTVPQDQGYNRPKQTTVTAFIQKEVNRAVTAEFKKAMQEAQDEVRAAVKERGAEVIAETVTRLAGVR